MQLCFLVLGDDILMAIALSLVIISLIAMYADLSQTHPLIWKVNCVFALLGEPKK